MAVWNPRANDLFLKALDLPQSGEREEFLKRACAEDTALRAEVQSLLNANSQAGSFLETPPDEAKPTAIYRPASESTGTMIGPYKLLQLIGEGGMGTVYMAEQTQTIQRKVALKIIKAGMDSKQVIARFEAERQALAMMDHVNIARVLDAGATETGSPYFVMELVHGVPITKYCDDNHLTPRERLELFLPVCNAIQHAHQKGIIHRDIKPSNVMITLYDGKPVPKVIDFGIAKAMEQKLTERTLFTQYGAMVGTLEYVSPEQAEMSALGADTRSDIYSLGVLLYELLTGTTPLSRERFKEAAYGEIVRMIKEEEPPKPSTRLSQTRNGERNEKAVPRSEFRAQRWFELDWIVMKCLEKDRNRRYETASAFAADVQRYLNDEPVQACPPSTWYRFRKFARRNRAALAMALVVSSALLLAVAVLAVSTVLIVREQRATENALQAETSAKDTLDKTLNHEKDEAYYRRIALAYRELLADNLGQALKLLNECPEDLRKWEWALLMRLCRVQQIVLPNGAGVASLSFSDDGERIATASLDGTLKVWNIKKRKVIWLTAKAHGVVASKPGFVSSVTFHPRGNHLASTGEDKLVKVWDLTSDRTDRPVFSQPCDAVHTVGTAYAAAFSPLDPNHLAVGSEGAVTIWDWRNEKRVHTYPAHPTQRICVAYSRDGRRLATGDWGGSVKLWNAEARGEPLLSFPETRFAISALSFSPDASRLATASFGRRVDVWNTTTGERVHQLQHSGRLVLAVAFSPDGRLIVSTGEDKAVHVWEAESGREVLGLRGHNGMCGCVAFSPDGLRLASASMDGTIRIWDATPLEGHEQQEMSSFSEPSGEIWSLTVSPDGRKIASAGYDNPAKVWDTETHKVLARLPDFKDIVFCVAWHRDGQRIAVAGGNGDEFTVKVWNAQNRREEFSLPIGTEYTAAAFSTDGHYLVTGRGNGKVQVWDARDGREIGVLGAHIGPVRGVVFSSDADGRYLASASADGKVYLWDAKLLGKTKEPQRALGEFPVHIPVASLNVAFSPDGKRIAIGATENRVVIREVETGKELTTLWGHSGDVYTVAFSPDGRLVASAGEDSTVKVWDSHTGKLLRSFRGHTGLVNSLAFTRDGQRLVTGSRDRKVKFWDVTQWGESIDSSSK